MIAQAKDAGTKKLALGSTELAVVRGILAQHVPGQNVWAFGSRVTGLRLKKFSDLDLALEGRLDWTLRANLHEAFDESDLPMKVDVLELDLVDAEFRERIEPDFLIVQAAGPSSPVSQNR